MKQNSHSVSPPRREARLFDQRGSRKYLNSSERKAFEKVIRAEPDRDRRAFLWTLFYCGCRISEALELTWDRVDLTGKALIFETLKRRKKGCFRAVPIPDFLVEEFRAMRLKKPSEDRVWPFSRTTGYRIVKRAMGKAGFDGPKACPKGLRHAFAVACVDKDILLNIVQRWMGHARLETTSIYLQVQGEEERKLAERIW